MLAGKGKSVKAAKLNEVQAVRMIVRRHRHYSGKSIG
jgi:hypothetical protein